MRFYLCQLSISTQTNSLTMVWLWRYSGARGVKGQRMLAPICVLWDSSSWMHKNFHKVSGSSEVSVIFPWQVRTGPALCRCTPQVPAAVVAKTRLPSRRNDVGQLILRTQTILDSCRVVLLLRNGFAKCLLNQRGFRRRLFLGHCWTVFFLCGVFCVTSEVLRSLTYLQVISFAVKGVAPSLSVGPTLTYGN